MKTVTEKYHAVNEGALSKAEFVRQMRLAHPQLISQFNGFDDSVQILKNRGLLFEKKDEAEYENPSYNLSPDAVRRGLRYELELAGLDPAGDISEADYIKAHKKAEENIMKDQLHYYRMITHGETKVEHDKMKETKRGAQETDADNAMAKVKLNEDVESKDEVESRTEKVGKAIVKDTEVMNTVKSFMKDAGLSYDIDSAKRTAKALYYRSDHYNFAKHNIPIIFYFNGTHADYHKDTDTPDKIYYELLRNRARLVFHTAWEVANREGRITADKLEEKKEETK